MKFPPENEKVDLALDRWPFLEVIFTSKVQIFMIFMEKWIFHEFHEFSPFSLKTALFAPKCTLGPPNHQYMLCYGRISAPGRNSALFRKKSHFLLIFTLFTKMTHFHDLHDF